MDPKMLASEACEFLNITLQGLHKQLKSKELNCSKSQNKVYFGHETARQLFNLQVSPFVVAMQIVKGGTGKTNIGFSLAVRASLYGLKVLVIDCDQQGNMTEAFNYDASETPVIVDFLNEAYSFDECIVPVIPGLDLLPSRIENAMIDNLITLKNLPLNRVFYDQIKSLKSKYDLILIDCPPALGAGVGAMTLSSDMVISPVDPDKFSMRGLQVTLKEVLRLSDYYERNLMTKVLVNKFDSRTSMSHSTLKELYVNEEYNKHLFQSFVRTSTEFPKAVQDSKSIFDSVRKSPAREDIDLVLQEILDIACNDSGQNAKQKQVTNQPEHAL